MIFFSVNKTVLIFAALLHSEQRATTVVMLQSRCPSVSNTERAPWKVPYGRERYTFHPVLHALRCRSS